MAAYHRDEKNDIDSLKEISAVKTPSHPVQRMLREEECKKMHENMVKETNGAVDYVRIGNYCKARCNIYTILSQMEIFKRSCTANHDNLLKVHNDLSSILEKYMGLCDESAMCSQTQMRKEK